MFDFFIRLKDRNAVSLSLVKPVPLMVSKYFLSKWMDSYWVVRLEHKEETEAAVFAKGRNSLGILFKNIFFFLTPRTGYISEELVGKLFSAPL